MTDLASTSAPTRGPGRPRAFDLQAALDRAIVVFTERGYHATSISDLSEAMEVTAGSLYKAFADKRAIFIAAFDRYKAQRDALLTASLGAGTSGRDRLARLLAFYADAASGESGRRGCLVVSTATELALFDAEIAGRVAQSFQRMEARIAGLIEEGRADGSIASGIDAQAIAHVMLSLIQGMRVIGKTGAGVRGPAFIEGALKLID